jgi:hypothetical protein
MPAALKLILHDVAAFSWHFLGHAHRKKLTFCPIFHNFFGPKKNLEAI